MVLPCNPRAIQVRLPTVVRRTVTNFPSGASYRVVVQTADGATPVPGWTPTELLDLRGTSAAAVQEWCYGGTAVGLAFRKGA